MRNVELRVRAVMVDLEDLVLTVPYRVLVDQTSPQASLAMMPCWEVEMFPDHHILPYRMYCEIISSLLHCL